MPKFAPLVTTGKTYQGIGSRAALDRSKLAVMDAPLLTPTREQLIHALYEAAELEHNLMHLPLRGVLIEGRNRG
jgi:hypothetical protein